MLIRSPEDAEVAVVEWLRMNGFSDARQTTRGADGGVDVESDRMVAQVKAEMQPTGRPAVQQIAGIASHEEKQALFFSLAGYTREAVDWAISAGVLLFRFDLQGEPEAVTETAARLAGDQLPAAWQGLVSLIEQQLESISAPPLWGWLASGEVGGPLRTLLVRRGPAAPGEAISIEGLVEAIATVDWQGNYLRKNHQFEMHAAVNYDLWIRNGGPSTSDLFEFDRPDAETGLAALRGCAASAIEAVRWLQLAASYLSLTRDDLIFETRHSPPGSVYGISDEEQSRIAATAEEEERALISLFSVELLGVGSGGAFGTVTNNSEVLAAIVEISIEYKTTLGVAKNTGQALVFDLGPGQTADWEDLLDSGAYMKRPEVKVSYVDTGT